MKRPQIHSPLRVRVPKSDSSTVFLMANTLEMGGTERHLSQLATGLNERKFRVELGCIRRQGSFAETLGTKWEVAEFGLGGSFFSRPALKSARALARHLLVRGVSVAHSFSFYSNLLMIPVARLARVPVVIGSHRQLGDLLTPLQFDSQNAVFRLCDRVVCNSKAAADRLTTRGLSPEKIAIIPNAVSPEIFSIALARKRWPVARPFRVGMMARMSVSKDYALLLRAAARLRSRSLNIQFFLIGDGPQRPELESMTRTMGLTGQVNFLGERRDLVDVLAQLDISVLASSSESSPNAITESMAAGLPVVASGVGGIPELISHGRNGLLMPLDDHVALAASIECLAENPNLCAWLGRNAYEFAHQHFRLEHVFSLYEQLYEGLLDH